MLGGNTRLVLDPEHCQDCTVPFFPADDKQRTSLESYFFFPLEGFLPNTAYQDMEIIGFSFFGPVMMGI